MARGGAMKPPPEMMRVELGELPLGQYMPDGRDQVPVMGSFAAVGLTAGGQPEPALAFAKLLRRGDELWAELQWTLHGREHVYKMPDHPLELAYAATVHGTGTKGTLARVLFLVVRPATGPRR